MSSVLTDPVTLELIDTTDPDALADAVVRCGQLMGELSFVRAECSRMLAELSSGDAKTRRLVTPGGRTLKIEMPSTTFDGKTLKALWDSHAELARQYLRIASIEVQRREVDKLRNTSGPEQFEKFKALVLGAERPPSGTPRIVVEQNSTVEQGDW